MHAGDARRALLGRLWDYAGVFPPAELPLDQAVAEWQRIRRSDDAWLVNRFVARAGMEIVLAQFDDRRESPFSGSQVCIHCLSSGLLWSPRL